MSGTAAWAAAHARRLTTAHLLGALGLTARAPAAQLGLPASRAGPAAARAAQRHLAGDSDGGGGHEELDAGSGDGSGSCSDGHGGVSGGGDDGGGEAASDDGEESGDGGDVDCDGRSAAPPVVAASSDPLVAQPAARSSESAAAAGESGGRTIAARAGLRPLSLDDVAAAVASAAASSSGLGVWRPAVGGAGAAAPPPESDAYEYAPLRPTPPPLRPSTSPPQPAPPSPPPARAPPHSAAQSVRLAWGAAQEATALLVALRALTSRGGGGGGGGAGAGEGGGEGGRVLVQVGLCRAEDAGVPRGAAPCLLGATPDALLLHADGRVSAVEVKAHCPFASAARGAPRRGRRDGRGLVARDDGPLPRLPAWAVPQLALETMCVGPECAGAYLVSLSHSRGARVWFLPRDEPFIAAMLGALSLSSAAGGRAAAGRARAAARARAALGLARAAARLARAARLVAHVPEEAVVRGRPGEPLYLPEE